MSKFSANDAGFTLIEVMVALAIFAVAASMLMLSGGNSIKQTGYLQEKVLATQVADQYLNRLYTEQRWPEKGIRGRVQRYAGYDWYIRESIHDTHIAGFRRVIADVFVGAAPPEDGDRYLATLTTHLRKPQK